MTFIFGVMPRALASLYSAVIFEELSLKSHVPVQFWNDVMVIRIEPLRHFHGVGSFRPTRHGKIPFIFVGNVPEPSGIAFTMTMVSSIWSYKLKSLQLIRSMPMFF